MTGSPAVKAASAGAAQRLVQSAGDGAGADAGDGHGWYGRAER